MTPRHIIAITAATIILSTASTSTAQHSDLVNSRRSSYYTFIYRLNNQEAEKLFTSMWDVDTTYFNNLHDFYPTDSLYTRPLPVGHYLFVSAIGDDVKIELRSVNNLQFHLLDNARDLVIVLNDAAGNKRRDAEIRIRNKVIPYDDALGAYRLAKTNRRGIVSVLYDGHASYFEIDRQYNNTFAVRAGRRIIATFPINHLISPVIYIKDNMVSLIKWGQVSPPGIYHRITRPFKPKPTKGYMVFNKPMFKPGDTVRLKAMVTTTSGKPINKRAYVFLASNHYGGPPAKKLATIAPFRKGAYEFTFILMDSLNLRLDNTYQIQLKDHKGNFLQTSTFRYEDYDLKSNVFSIRTDQGLAGKPSKLYLKGEDTNGLPVFNVRTEILLKPLQVEHCYTPRTFIPDTLWYHETRLDAVGETIVTIPDSVMPPAKLKYSIEVAFFDASNERVIKTATLTSDFRAPTVKMEIQKDSLYIWQITGEKVKDIVLTRQGHFHSETMIDLPYTEKLNVFVDSYELRYTDNGNKIASLLVVGDLIKDNLDFLATRTKDSIHISTTNPHQIPFQYFLFRNRTLVERGEGEALYLKRSARPSDHYSLSVQYIWAGRSRTREFDLGLQKHRLSVKLNHPPLIYPGEKATLTVNVRDAYGRPVKNADVTAYGITGKFQHAGQPFVPVFQEKRRTRLIFNRFNAVDRQANVSKNLEDIYWRTTLGLDSITFYRFLLPDTGYFEHRAPAKTTQFAPFVVTRGTIQPVRIIYVDGQPVFFHAVNTREPYSFHITPGRHTVSLRLNSRMVTIRNVLIRENEKLIFSVDERNLPTGSETEEAPFTLTEEEVARLSRYFMMVQTSQGEPEAYLQQGPVYRLFTGFLRTYYRQYDHSKLLTGPFYPGKATFAMKDSFNLSFDFEPLSIYEFKRGLVKMRRTDIQPHINTRSHWGAPPLNHEILTLDSIKNYWKALDFEQGRLVARIPDITFDQRHAGRLTLERLPNAMQGVPVRATLLLNLDNPSDRTLISGQVSNVLLWPGKYQATVVLANRHYLIIDSIVVRPYGINYHTMESAIVSKPDSLVHRIINMITTWSKEFVYNPQTRMKQLFEIQGEVLRQNAANYHFAHTVRGMVYDSEGNPVPGVNVVVKGTAIGTVTGLDGRYELNCPANGTLVFSFIGFQTTETAVNWRANVNATLHEDVTQLNEIVVMGYAASTKRNMTGAVALEGNTAGLAVGLPGIQIRGVAASSSHTPLYILDGVVVTANEIDPGTIHAVEYLSGSVATSLYGARAGDGVVLLSTRPGTTREELIRISLPKVASAAFEDTPGNALRKNFRDYAFWQPALLTDESGTAQFETTFPDDITGWSTHVLAMAGKSTGQTSTTIRSYKPLVAQVVHPHFLITGDSASAIGKVTNYGGDTVKLDRLVNIAETDVRRDSLLFTDSHIDTIAVTTSLPDSLAIRYTVAFNKYHDGELRRIPVYPAGTKQIIGGFTALHNDTTVHFSFSRDAPVRLSAHTDLIDVVFNEIRFIRNYEFDCNEQLASRIIGLLLEKKIRTWRNEKFDGERELQRALRKLAGHQNRDGGWAWWSTGESRSWITVHVARSLELARREGYDTPVNFDALVTYLEINLSNLRDDNRLAIQALLMERGERLQVTALVDSLTGSQQASLHDKLYAQRLLQLSGRKPDLEWLHAQKSISVKGNFYWGEESLELRDNSIANTLVAYKIIESENPRSNDLRQIRNYLLEKRGKSWRNTYESSLILETILPAILAEGSSGTRPTLVLSGTEQRVVNTFPFEYTLSAENNFYVSKTGDEPVYFTAYQELWNPTPQAIEKEFTVKTAFEDSVNTLDAGKPVDLLVTVEVHGRAEYLMIEVPIAAGCSYAAKPQSTLNGEVHREYYHHKVNIYCEVLEKGVYTYRIPLLPRFTGSYTLNPAVASCMYFPTLNGREGLKQVRIE